MKKNIKYIVAIVLIILFVFSIVPKEFQNDTFYIIALGQSINSRGLDRLDHFSWHNNLEYRYPHWLFDVINANIYNFWGLNGIYLFVCIVSSLSMILIFCIMLKKKINWFIAFVSTLIVAYMIRIVFTARAQIISYPLLLIEILLIERFLKSNSKFKDVVTILGLTAVSCIIANVHSTIWIMVLVLFLPYIGEQFICYYDVKEFNKREIERKTKKLEKLEKINAKKEEIEKLKKDIDIEKEIKKDLEVEKETKIVYLVNKKIKWIIIPLIFVVLGALITPIGNIPFVYYLKTSHGNSLLHINEHLPTIPITDLEFFTFSAIVIAMLGFTDSKIKLSDGLLTIGLFIMALSSKRNVFLMIFLCSPIIVKMIDDFINKNKSNAETDNKRIDSYVNFLFIIVCGIVLIYSIINIINKLPKDYIPEEVYPVKAAEYIKNNLDYKNIKLYNEYDYGSYLLWKGIPVFLDSRCDLYTTEFNKGVTVFNDYMDMISNKLTISSLMNKYEMTYLITKKESAEYLYVVEDSRYNKIYEDDNFIVCEYNYK